MHFDIVPPIRTGILSNPASIVVFSQAAERCGFDALVLPEHVARVAGRSSSYPYASAGGPPATAIFPDPLETLSFVAGVTKRIGLATGVLILPQHHPVQLAKRLATLDVLSRGRVRAGVGVGWDTAELELFGVDQRTRGDRADEILEAMRALWSDTGEAGASYYGKFVRFESVVSMPKPLRPIPVFIGGNSRRAACRAGRLGDGFQPLDLEGAPLEERLRTMRDAAARAGRDADEIELVLRRPTGAVTPESIEEDSRLGTTRIVVSVPHTSHIAEAVEAMEAFAERVGIGRG